MKKTPFRIVCRFVLITLVVSSSQLFGLEVTQAEELIESRTPIVDQDNRKELQISKVNSTFSRLGSAWLTQFESDVYCLALNIYFEARGEPEKGQHAVGYVVMNRVAHSRYPNTVCDVVHQGGEQRLYRCQFSWWCDGLSDKPVDKIAWEQSLRLARKIYLGAVKDTTDGALWYHATHVTPYWSKVFLQGPKIGQHIFYLERRRPESVL